MKVEFAISGIMLVAVVGWLVGALWENPPGPGGYQAIGALLGAILAGAVLLLGLALKENT